MRAELGSHDRCQPTADSRSLLLGSGDPAPPRPVPPVSHVDDAVAKDNPAFRDSGGAESASLGGRSSASDRNSRSLSFRPGSVLDPIPLDFDIAADPGLSGVHVLSMLAKACPPPPPPHTRARARLRPRLVINVLL